MLAGVFCLNRPITDMDCKLVNGQLSMVNGETA